MQFGRRSEQLGQTIDQLELRSRRTGDAKAPSAAPAVAAEPAEANKPARKPAIPAAREVVLAPARLLSGLRRCLEELGEDVAELLEYVPARFKVVPDSPSLPAHAATPSVQAGRPADSAWHGGAARACPCPANTATTCRSTGKAEIYAREGVELERSTLAEWVGQSATALAAGGDLAASRLPATKVTRRRHPVPVLAPGSGKTKTGRLGPAARHRPAAATVPPAVWFRLLAEPSRRTP